MDFSIIMPVADREDLTRACLESLLPTLAGAGEGEVIVVDNGSLAATADVLAQFPWVRTIRNERNFGFAAACNIGARAARGRLICHLNNDIVARPGWLAAMTRCLAPDVGVVGARLLYPDDTIQHAGVALAPVRFGSEGCGPYHPFKRWPANEAVCTERFDCAAVTGACLLTPRELFLELDGFDEIFWNGYEDVDYCLRVGARGLRVVYEPAATLYHYESQSGVQRKRRLTHNRKTFGRRWAAAQAPDHNRFWTRAGLIQRESFDRGYRNVSTIVMPAVSIVVHGSEPLDRPGFLRLLRDTRAVAQTVYWLAASPAPAGCTKPAGSDSPVAALATLLERRGDHYWAFVHTATALARGWLDELINELEFGADIVAATALPAQPQDEFEPCASDARCAVVNLRSVPANLRFGTVDTVDGALVDLTWQAVQAGLGVRGLARCSIEVGEAEPDAAFAQRWGVAPDIFCRPDGERLESAYADRARTAGVVSIVIPSWNAPDLTRAAIESIRRNTRAPYEIIVVDDGSADTAVQSLREITGIELISHPANCGYARACNTGLAAARGSHVVLLNADVIVSAGWLDRLLDAFARDPLVGASVPRSNNVRGHQRLAEAAYATLGEMEVFAAKRARAYARRHYRTNRASTFCMCISRAVIEEVGGLDPVYAANSYEDDDYCLRVRAAGFAIVVCEDAFVHHDGGATRAAKELDAPANRARSASVFARRWGLAIDGADDPIPAIARGFLRSRDYVALPSAVRANGASIVRT
jgi:GT2 family glycosyltransferase